MSSSTEKKIKKNFFVELDMTCHENFFKAHLMMYKHRPSDRGAFGVNPQEKKIYLTLSKTSHDIHPLVLSVSGLRSSRTPKTKVAPFMFSVRFHHFLKF